MPTEVSYCDRVKEDNLIDSYGGYTSDFLRANHPQKIFDLFSSGVKCFCPSSGINPVLGGSMSSLL